MSERERCLRWQMDGGLREEDIHIVDSGKDAVSRFAPSRKHCFVFWCWI